MPILLHLFGLVAFADWNYSSPPNLACLGPSFHEPGLLPARRMHDLAGRCHAQVCSHTAAVFVTISFANCRRGEMLLVLRLESSFDSLVLRSWMKQGFPCNTIPIHQSPKYALVALLEQRFTGATISLNATDDVLSDLPRMRCGQQYCCPT